jgi:hypothetical protein
MENLKERIARIDSDSRNDSDMNALSLADFYCEVIKEPDKKRYRRLRLIMGLYPMLYIKNRTDAIKKAVNNPDNACINVSSRRWYYPWERKNSVTHFREIYNFFGLK